MIHVVFRGVLCRIGAWRKFSRRDLVWWDREALSLRSPLRSPSLSLDPWTSLRSDSAAEKIGNDTANFRNQKPPPSLPPSLIFRAVRGPSSAPGAWSWTHPQHPQGSPKYSKRQKIKLNRLWGSKFFILFYLTEPGTIDEVILWAIYISFHLNSKYFYFFEWKWILL